MNFKMGDRVEIIGGFGDQYNGRFKTIHRLSTSGRLAYFTFPNTVCELAFWTGTGLQSAEIKLVESANPDYEIRKVVTKKFGNSESKLDWTLLPVEALEEVVKVLNFGNSPEKGYGRESWKKETILKQLQSITRHVAELLKDPKATDPETGLSHAAHAACRALFIVGILKGGE